MSPIVFDEKERNEMEKWVQRKERESCCMSWNPWAYRSSYAKTHNCNNRPYVKPWTSAESITLIFNFQIIVSKAQRIRTKLIFAEVILEVSYFHTAFISHSNKCLVPTLLRLVIVSSRESQKLTRQFTVCYVFVITQKLNYLYIIVLETFPFSLRFLMMSLDCKWKQSKNILWLWYFHSKLISSTAARIIYVFCLFDLSQNSFAILTTYQK